MTTIRVEVQDESKAEDVFRFSKDISFLNVHMENRPPRQRRKPTSGLAETRITGDIMSPVEGRVPHPDLKYSIEVCGDLMNTVPSASGMVHEGIVGFGCRNSRYHTPDCRDRCHIT